MEQKNSKIFSKETIQLVTAFCESQEIKDVSNFMYLCFKQGFDIKKYGFLGETEQEKIVEVPVEIIKEVEKIVEVPVEKVVTKIEYIRDKNNENELGEKITKLEKEMSKKDEELDELRRNLDIIVDKPPVEVIKEVEKIVEVIKEVPVEVIKEVDKIVTNIEYISDKTTENELGEIIANLETETAKKNEELDELRQTLDELRQKLDIKEDNNKIKLLQETLQNLRGELQKKNEQIKELEKINRDLLNGNQNQGYLLRGSNLNKKA